MSCAELGPDLVALALGQADADEAARVEAHVAGCAPCREELTAARSLFGIAKARPLPACAPGAEERLLAAIRDERDATSGGVPAPVARPRRAQRVLRMFVPLAAAAAVLVAITVSGRERPVRVLDGEGLLFAEGDPAHPGLAIGRGSPGAGASAAEFAFRAGDEVASRDRPLSVRLSFAAGASEGGPGEPAAGAVEIVLAPGARIVRRDGCEIELVAGSVDVAAGPLAQPLVVSAPPNSATIRGTRFTASTSERRLVVAVARGSVEIAGAGGRAAILTAGQEGLVDGERLLTRTSDGRGARQVFLTPRASLSLAASPTGRTLLEARIGPGEGGPVAILAFDDSEPRFLLRLKGDDGLEREVKLQRSMLTEAPPASPGGLARLGEGRSYAVSIDPAALGVAPGRYQATLRYVSYRARSDGTEWLGVVESSALPIEVPAK